MKNDSAVAYYRTSSATNVATNKDSLNCQQDAVQAYAAVNGISIVREFYDAVSGADSVTVRPGFMEMLTYILGDGAHIVLVENASRFARDVAVQIVGHDLLKSRGISLIPVDAPNHFQDETPTATMVRSILGAVSQFEKEALVLKLRKARERKRRETGRCEGNPTWTAVPADAANAAKAAHARGLSLRAVAVEIAAQGFLSPSGKPYGAESIQAMIETPEQRAARRAKRRSANKQRSA
jgi:DNA invertase Pin-like site-specific DNA recombinase